MAVFDRSTGGGDFWQKVAQEAARVALRSAGDLLGRAGSHDLTPRVPTLGSEIYYVV